MNRLLSPALLALATSLSVAHAEVRISEFAALNDSTLIDFDLDASDWIELENTGPGSVFLGGWYLTDDPQVLDRWRIPNVELAAGQRLIVFASGKDLAWPELHANFSLSGGGEYLALVRPDGLTIEHDYAPVYPPQVADVTYGLPAGGGAPGYFPTPTPLGPNGTVHGLTEKVKFSRDRGFHDVAFDLALTCETAGAQIRYTLDGSEPTATTGAVYGGPLAITQSTIVRAAAFVPGLPTIHEVSSRSFLFPSDVVGQTDAAAYARGFPQQWIDVDGVSWSEANGGTHPGARYGLDPLVLAGSTEQELRDGLLAIPSISLAMSIDDWFGHAAPSGVDGIYPNSKKTVDFHGESWERTCSAEWIDPSGGPEFQSDAGVNVQGGSSTFPELRSHLSLSLKFKGKHGPADLDFPLFPGSPVDEFEHLILDAGNQNSIHKPVGYNFAQHAQALRDQFLMDLQEDAGGRAPRGRHAHLFLNGLYWGIVDVHERPDERWAAAHFGGDEEDWDSIKEGAVLHGNGNDYGHPDGAGQFFVAEAIAMAGVGPEATWEGQPAYEALGELLDYPSYVDYLILNQFVGNTDWPQRNWMATLRARDGAEPYPGKLHYHTWDAEQTMPWGGGIHDVGGFYDVTGATGVWSGSAVFFHTELIENPEYVVLYGDRFEHLTRPGGPLWIDPAYSSSGSPFDPAHPERNRPAALYEARASEIADAMRLAYARWGNYFLEPGTLSIDEWQVERERIVEDYLPVRTEVLRAQLRNAGLYPELDTPVPSHWGGVVAPGSVLTLSQPDANMIVYTTDGSDPRLPGGTVSVPATKYTGPIPLAGTVVVNARARKNGNWSALLQLQFVVDTPVRFNELTADNDNGLPDEAGQFEDWFELVNHGMSSVDLGGMFLTDDLSNTTKWEIPAATILAPGEALLFFADEDQEDGPLHTNFKLSKGGEELGLFLPESVGNQLVDSVVFGVQATDESQGRLPDGGETWVHFPAPTAGVSNMPAAGLSAAFEPLSAGYNGVGLSVAGPAQLGSPLQLEVDGAGANGFGAIVLGFETDAFVLFENGELQLVPSFPSLWPLFAADLGGEAEASLSLGGNPALVGLTFYMQALAFPGGLSNGLAITIG